MEDESKAILILSIVFSLCVYAAIIYALYTKVLVFMGGFVVGLVILAPMLSYMAAKVVMWVIMTDSW